MSKPPFALIPGVEITNGTVGSVSHGTVDSSHTWGDPVAAARPWIDQGAQWLHVADLDAAAGTGSNASVLSHVAREVRGRARFEVSGGIVDESTLAAALALGADRVVVDAAAWADGVWVTAAFAAHGDRLAAGITAHRQQLVAPGTNLDGTDLDDIVHRFNEAGARAWLVTDVDANGLRKSRDRHVLEAVCARAHGEVIAFGGIERLDDLHALTAMTGHGIAGAVVDRALYTEAFTFAEAIAAIEPRFDMFFWGPAQV